MQRTVRCSSCGGQRYAGCRRCVHCGAGVGFSVERFLKLLIIAVVLTLVAFNWKLLLTV
jgi:hypothetical protein